jgi:beta-glucosidase
MYFPYKPLYPFGYGLSYTTFAYSNLRMSRDSLPVNGAETATVDVTNTGRRDGDEVVQMYAQYIVSSVSRPKEQLIGFQRVHIAAGHTKSVALPLRAADLAYWNVAQHKFVVENRPVRILVGSSSADLPTMAIVPVSRN